MKSKTTTAFLAFFGGMFGLHRFYLRGWGDVLGWLLPIPTALGFYGLERVRQFGQDDQLSWVLIPLLGFTISICALTAIVYALMSQEKWNAYMGYPSDAPAGRTHWGTILVIVASLLIGTTILMASIVYSFQHYFEHQIELGREIAQ